MVTNILRPTVYFPVQHISTLIVGRQRAQLLGVVATFVVSGLMHEALYYYLTRMSPTWEVTGFFVLQGVCVAAEILVKKGLADRWQLPSMVSGLLTVVFVAVTGVWLFFPQLLRSNSDEKALGELSVLVDCIKRVLRIDKVTIN
ncbi:hypothetical protein Patl1_04075 [Pistacia atlantica]|uniref:Uncharacterized protein n=1 Tax=Pistacia atlantica TaxID=434234 RepID=A0ACC1BQJ2_9ROSI|nr:hypothetical protein Patl1_04075 [Pistacia atlantica]